MNQFKMMNEPVRSENILTSNAFPLMNEPVTLQISVHFQNMTQQWGTKKTIQLFVQASNPVFNYELWDIFVQEDKALIAMANLIKYYGVKAVSDYVLLIYGKNVA